jgi:RNA polymerase-binding transcription factor
VAEYDAAQQALAVLRAETLARLDGLEREFRGIVESSGVAGTDDEHDPEGATVAFERQHIATLLAETRQRLAQIDEALARVADGSYGRCAACGQPVGVARLAARPMTTTCIRCAYRR